MELPNTPVITAQLKQLASVRSKSGDVKFVRKSELKGIWSIHRERRNLGRGNAAFCNCCGRRAQIVYSTSGFDLCTTCFRHSVPKGRKS